MPVSRTSFQKGNQAAKGHVGKGGRPPEYAKLALRDILTHMGEGPEDTSLRTRAIGLLEDALTARDMLGHPNSTAVKAATKILEVTDPEDMHVGDGEPTGDLTITIKYEGAIPASPQPGSLPSQPPRGPAKDPRRAPKVQRGPVRKAVRKDNPR